MMDIAFEYSTNERFADVQLLRYRLNGFEELTLQQKKYIYYLSEATLWGRDITFDQFGRYNLEIRRLLERSLPLTPPKGMEGEWKAMEE